VDYREVKHLKIALDKGMVREDFKCVNLLNDDKEQPNARLLKVQPDSFTKRLHRYVYQLLYIADIPYSRVFRGKSVIPIMHFYLGMRPYLNKKQCTDCRECIPICPVNAIKIPQRSIDANLCMPVRCMKCIPACPENAIGIRGRKVPNNSLEYV
jgi:ferredoxin